MGRATLFSRRSQTRFVYKGDIYKRTFNIFIIFNHTKCVYFKKPTMTKREKITQNYYFQELDVAVFRNI